MCVGNGFSISDFGGKNPASFDVMVNPLPTHKYVLVKVTNVLVKGSMTCQYMMTWQNDQSVTYLCLYR